MYLIFTRYENLISKKVCIYNNLYKFFR